MHLSKPPTLAQVNDTKNKTTCWHSSVHSMFPACSLRLLWLVLAPGRCASASLAIIVTRHAQLKPRCCRVMKPAMSLHLNLFCGSADLTMGYCWERHVKSLLLPAT
jgi:hypothetical protein